MVRTVCSHMRGRGDMELVHVVRFCPLRLVPRHLSHRTRHIVGSRGVGTCRSFTGDRRTSQGECAVSPTELTRGVFRREDAILPYSYEIWAACSSVSVQYIIKISRHPRFFNKTYKNPLKIPQKTLDKEKIKCYT